MATIKFVIPDLQGQPFAADMPGSEISISEWGVADEPVQSLVAKGGEVNIYSATLLNPSKGKAIALTGGGTNLDLKGIIGPETLSAEDEDGNPIEITVLEQHARDGWGPADYFMLETDPTTGDLIIDPGINQVEIFITASTAAYDETKIAAEVGGGATAATITGAWIRDTALGYGRSPEKAITGALAVKWSRALTRTEKVMPSVVYSFERGYKYSGVDYATQNLHGQGPLNPRVFKAHGTGTAPYGMSIGFIKNFMPSHTVCIGVMPDPGSEQYNLLVADVDFDADKKGHGISLSGQRSAGFSLYRTFIYGATDPSPHITLEDGSTQWDDSNDRASGIYTARIKGQLREKVIWWRNGWDADDGTGWEDGGGYNYGQNREGNLPQPPSGLSHDDYFSEENYDVTQRNTISIQAANSSWQFRMGGWLLNCMSIDAGIHGSGGGVYRNHSSGYGNRGMATKVFRNVSTSSPYHVYTRNRTASGARGMDLTGNLMTLLDSVIMHAADPDNATEIAAKAVGNHLQHALADAMKVVAGSNIVAWNWGGTSRNFNVASLNASLMNTTTIQRWGATKRGQATTIYQFAQWLLDSVPLRDRFAVVSDTIKYFLTAIQPVLVGRLEDAYLPRATPVHQVFNAVAGSDGFRWDYPLHWSDRWIPGQNPLDSADLNGNSVKFLIDTSTIAALTFKGGDLTVSSGKLTVGEHTDFARVTAMNCGQYIAPLGAADYVLRGGGRVVLPEGITAVTAEASGQSQLLLPRDATLTKLHITGGMGWVGWDQIDGTAELEVTDELIFEFTPVLGFGYFGIDPWDLEIHGLFDGEVSGFKGKYDCFRNMNGSVTKVRIRDASGPLPAVGETVMRRNYLVKQDGALLTPSAIFAAEVGRIERFRSGRRTTANPTGLTNPGVAGTVVLPVNLDLIIKGAQYAVPGQQYDMGGGAGTGVTYVNAGVTLPANFSLISGKLIWTAPN